MYLLGLIGTGLLGFALGLFAFKVKSRYCPRCGTTTSALSQPAKLRRLDVWP